MVATGQTDQAAWSAAEITHTIGPAVMIGIAPVQVAVLPVDYHLIPEALVAVAAEVGAAEVAAGVGAANVSVL